MSESMSEKMYIVDLSAVCGSTRGIKANELVRNYVRDVLKLNMTDRETKVWFQFDGVVDYWNSPASMNVDLAQTPPYCNGGFRDRLSAAFAKREKTTPQKSDGVVPTGESANTTPRRSKFTVDIKIDTGTILIKIDDLTGSYNVPGGTMMVPGVLMSTCGKAFIDCASNWVDFIRKHVSRETEYALDRYTTTKGNDADSAKNAILAELGESKNWAELARVATMPIVAKPNELSDFIARWSK